jgi:hypothetical protein
MAEQVIWEVTLSVWEVKPFVYFWEVNLYVSIEIGEVNLYVSIEIGEANLFVSIWIEDSPQQ